MMGGGAGRPPARRPLLPHRGIGHGRVDHGFVPIAVSNSGNSCCVAVESTFLEKFEETIGIRF